MGHITTGTSGKPILITRMFGQMLFEELTTVWEHVDHEISKQENTMFYWIIDFTDLLMSYSDFIKAVETSTLGMPGTVSDPRLIPIVVGNMDLYTVLRDMAIDRSTRKESIYPFFTRVCDAYVFIELIRSDSAA